MTPDPTVDVARSTLDTLETWARSHAPHWSGHIDAPTVDRQNMTTLIIRQEGWEATWWVDLVFGRLSVRITGAWLAAIDELQEWAKTLGDSDLADEVDRALNREDERHMKLITQPRMNRPDKPKEKPMKDEKAPALPRFGQDYTPRIRKARNR
jgi:hypothetical protein